MDYSHVENNLEFLIEHFRVNTGKEPNEQTREFFANVLNLTYGDGYRRAVEAGEEAKIKDKFNLTLEQHEMFIQIHKSHMKAMGTDSQRKYAMENVKNVIWDKKENCLKVYYDDTWWHYDTRGCWY